MFLRLVRFTLAASARSRAEAIAEDLIPAIKQQPGCLSAVFYGGGTDGECGICVLWASQEHAAAAAAVMNPRLAAHIAGNVVAPPERGLFPVLAH
jgi:quinol monooxygenase YgiN